jgi:hypothetical protein
MGHIQPECPSKKAGQPKTFKAIAMSGGKKSGPYLAVDLSAIDERSDRTLRMMANLDSGAELDCVGENWASYLEMHGGAIETLEVPQTVEWSDKAVTREAKSTVRMRFKIAGSEIGGELTFYLLPWDTDHLVIGWEAMRRYQLLGKLEDLMVLQEAQGLAAGVNLSDGNRRLTDMNGREMSTDELLFADEPEVESPQPASELTPAEEKEMSEILEKYKEVFVPKPAGSAQVEPMAVVFKDGWKAPPMEAFRSYAPRVEAAIEADLKKQLEMGVVEPSEADFGCAVHAVPKPDSESGYRFTVDFRPVNSGVVTESYPLPSVSEVLSSLRGARYRAKMDLKSGYWQFGVRPSDRRHLTFFLGKDVFSNTVWPRWVMSSLVSMFSGAWPACLRSPSPAVLLSI